MENFEIIFLVAVAVIAVAQILLILRFNELCIEVTTIRKLFELFYEQNLHLPLPESYKYAPRDSVYRNSRPQQPNQPQQQPDADLR